ncbi:hypothetical protein HF325_000705 [Metschnikowia pulcherrima]|uniref:Major facilitator superfamily (MFS) profile domain-containing protein n=1 Tax=Metschnikowia pulcherrima TaxID=27326 RepID=A0A8H7LEW4_9ASCO|nr:hypothetical protein HF325_000705 [Metschnikowia pulcherrima]
MSTASGSKQNSIFEHTNTQSPTPQPNYISSVGIEKPSRGEHLENADARSVGSRFPERPKLLRKITTGNEDYLEDGRRLLREKDCYDKLGYSFTTKKKWLILSTIFMVQISMNLNAGIFPNAISLVADEFGVSMPKARVSQIMFMIMYALGCELWAPWSEEFGRWPIMQCSLFLVNIWQILGGLAPNFASVVVARSLGGLCSAGGSVTLGIVADMWEANDQGYAVAFIVLSSVGGSSLGPIFGGILQDNLSWRWNFWIQLIVGAVMQAAHFFLVSETKASVLIDREAKRRRAEGEEDNCYGPGEIHQHKMTMGEIVEVWKRPFVMFLTEPIVLFLSLLSGFSDALIFHNPWIAPMIFSVLIAIANYSIYMSTIDYMVAAYGSFSASATGGNGFARNFLAGIAATYAEPMYHNIGKSHQMQWASTLLGALAVLVMIPIYVFYWKGPEIRARSKFAQVLAADRKAKFTPEGAESFVEKPGVSHV